jgi:hypothetical protein
MDIISVKVENFEKAQELYPIGAFVDDRIDAASLDNDARSKLTDLLTLRYREVRYLESKVRNDDHARIVGIFKSTLHRCVSKITKDPHTQRLTLNVIAGNSKHPNLKPACRARPHRHNPLGL